MQNKLQERPAGHAQTFPGGGSLVGPPDRNSPRTGRPSRRRASADSQQRGGFFHGVQERFGAGLGRGPRPTGAGSLLAVRRAEQRHGRQRGRLGRRSTRIVCALHALSKVSGLTKRDTSAIGPAATAGTDDRHVPFREGQSRVHHGRTPWAPGAVLTSIPRSMDVMRAPTRRSPPRRESPRSPRVDPPKGHCRGQWPSLRRVGRVGPHG